MRVRPTVAIFLGLAACSAVAEGQQVERPYRLSSVDLKERVIWGAESRQPAGKGLAFGGQDQDADDGRPHTRLLEGDAWRAIHEDLRAKNPLQRFQRQAWKLRSDVKNACARLRYIYFQGLSPVEEATVLRTEGPRRERAGEALSSLVSELEKTSGGEYEQRQIRFALDHLQAAKAQIPPALESISADTIKALSGAQVHLELAAEAMDSEPPARALHCGIPRKKGDQDPPARGIVYDAKTGLYVIFGGDHFDYLTNDVWVFDSAKKRWFQRHPASGAPAPRANHRLEALGDGKVRMTGGYTYSSNTDYVGGQYKDLNDGPWIYDIEKDKWSGGDLVPSDSRIYRSGPFHPEFYLQGDKPNAAAFEKRLRELPVNEWVATDPPYRARLNRDWGTARIDPDRDMMLRWSGGHSAHGGTDVLHFHFAANRWELPIPVEFPLGQLYSNTGYPGGFNFNLRPWMTGHTYQNYAYDPPSKKMVKAGRPRHYYVYDPDVGDWIGRGNKPEAMKYNSCFYTLTLVATPRGAVCWDKNGKVHRFEHEQRKWTEIELSGAKLPGAEVDNSTIAYDSRRDRVLMFRKPYGKTPYDGQVYALGLKSQSVTALSPDAMDSVRASRYIDRCCYDAANDLVLMATFLEGGGDHTPTPAYDCANNRWIMLDIKYNLGSRYGKTTRLFPHGRSCGIMYDPKRKLIWGTDTDSQVYVLRLERDTAGGS
ncbi:MAG: hypothetical protein QGI24_05435, partial [Kiritimatiellia bacterium]|jgi:hypothetical protein|nr:hypothetical protein [Kiritimatiellia bacterium]MDP6848212.1 hypothetical protein [Kiritimatiellia bacterium]